MAVVNEARDVPHLLGGERPIKPGQEEGIVETPKLPLPVAPDATGPPPQEVRKAWNEYMVKGFQHNDEMFKRTLEAFMRPY